MADKMPQLQKELAQIAGRARLTSAVEDLDNMIELLSNARELVASGSWPSACPPSYGLC